MLSYIEDINEKIRRIGTPAYLERTSMTTLSPCTLDSAPTPEDAAHVACKFDSFQVEVGFFASSHADYSKNVRWWNAVRNCENGSGSRTRLFINLSVTGTEAATQGLIDTAMAMQPDGLSFDGFGSITRALQNKYILYARKKNPYIKLSLEMISSGNVYNELFSGQPYTNAAGTQMNPDSEASLLGRNDYVKITGALYDDGANTKLTPSNLERIYNYFYTVDSEFNGMTRYQKFGCQMLFVTKTNNAVSGNKATRRFRAGNTIIAAKLLNAKGVAIYNSESGNYIDFTLPNIGIYNDELTRLTVSYTGSGSTRYPSKFAGKLNGRECELYWSENNGTINDATQYIMIDGEDVDDLWAFGGGTAAGKYLSLEEGGTVLEATTFNKTLTVGGAFSAKGGATITGNISATGAGSVGSTMSVGGTLTVGGDTTLTGSTSIKSGLELYFSTPFIDFHFGNSTADYTSRIIESSSGTLTLSNNIASGSATFSGNVSAGGTLSVTGATTLSSTVAIKGAQTNTSTIVADGRISSKDTVGQISDRRHKCDIYNIDRKQAYEKALKVDGVYYKMRNDLSKRRVGFIAQNVRLQFPEVVYTDENGYLGMSYQELVPVLFQALKYQDDMIKEIRNEIKDRHTPWWKKLWDYVKW